MGYPFHEQTECPHESLQRGIADVEEGRVKPLDWPTEDPVIKATLMTPRIPPMDLD